MDTSGELAQPQVRSRKLHRSMAEKRRIVEETLVQGESVARVARANGVNANQLFYWRKQYRTGELGGRPKAIELLPVTIAAAADPAAGANPGSSCAAPLQTGTIHIKIGVAQIRVEGTVDGALLRVVLESLRG